MCKTKLLLDVVQDIKALGESLQALADVLVANESVEMATSKTSPADGSEVSVVQSPKITLVDVRTALAKKSQEGFTQQVQSIIRRFDAERLSDINPKHYEEILLLAEELSNE